VDIWSCGVILYAMVCGFLPFEDPDTAKLYQKILSGEFYIPKQVSGEGKEILKKILNTDPDKRYTSDQIRTHSWFQQYKPICENQGLIIGRNVIPIEKSIVKMLEQYGFKEDYAQKCLNNNKHNQVTTIYYLLHKKQQLEGTLPSHFNINSHREKENKKEEVEKKSQGKSPVAEKGRNSQPRKNRFEQSHEPKKVEQRESSEM